MAEAKKRTALDIIRSYDGPKIRIMEVCGTHTHEIFRQGIRQILPPQVDVISGPGCPVCVTPIGYIDQAIWLALEKGVTICTFGDLVRVPGSTMSLADARSQGGHVEIVYSPLDAYDYAKAHPDEDVVFLSVGFETTTPPSCLAVRQAVADGTIEVIATDHAPHTAEQKSRGLAGSAMGIVGLECAFPLLYTYLVKPGLLTLEQLVERMSMAPRRIFGLGGGLQAGELADLTVFDLDAEYEIDPETFLSKGRATPFAGWRVAGRTLWTLVGGRTAYATERFR